MERFGLLLTGALMIQRFCFTDILGNILKKITAKRSRARVVDKLLSMGLVSERRELYKKKSRGSRGKSTGEGMVRFHSSCGNGGGEGVAN